jgi:hypothetical protein
VVDLIKELVDDDIGFVKMKVGKWWRLVDFKNWHF